MWITIAALVAARIGRARSRLVHSPNAAALLPAFSNTIQRLYNVMGRISDGPSAGFLDGPVEQWVEDLTLLTLDYGMESYIFAPSESPASQLERFATEVAPRVRENVARDRAARDRQADISH